MLTAPFCAHASIFDTYGFGSRGSAMGNALTAGAQDYHAVYYNPALLMQRSEVHVGVGVQLVEPILSINRTKLDSEVPSLLPTTNLGFTLGVSTPIGGFFENKLAFGVAIFIPLLRLTRAEFVDASTPQFYMYESLPDKLQVGVAAAGEPLPWLKLGIGIQVLADLDGTADFTLSLPDQQITRRHFSIDLHADLAATAGVAFVPMEGLCIGVSFRESLDLAFELPVHAELEGLGTLDFEIQGIGLYTPHQVNMGVSWRLPWIPLTVATDVTWAFWSQAPSPTPTTGFSLTPSELQALTGDDPLFEVQSEPIPLYASDIWIPRVGLEYVLGDFDLRAGYFFRATPLPSPVQQSNYVDSDVHVLTLGASWSFADPTRVHKRPLTVGLSLQGAFMRSRTIQKARPDDPTGSYSAGGAVFSMAFDIQHDF
jgi:long-chain fatty acid transport protein